MSLKLTSHFYNQLIWIWPVKILTGNYLKRRPLFGEDSGLHTKHALSCPCDYLRLKLISISEVK